MQVDQKPLALEIREGVEEEPWAPQGSFSYVLSRATSLPRPQNARVGRISVGEYDGACCRRGDGLSRGVERGRFRPSLRKAKGPPDWDGGFSGTG